MNCACEQKARCIEVNPTDWGVHRRYQCKCGLRFSTGEQLIVGTQSNGPSKSGGWLARRISSSPNAAPPEVKKLVPRKPSTWFPSAMEDSA
jgi:hypothetical protein